MCAATARVLAVFNTTLITMRNMSEIVLPVISDKCQIISGTTGVIVEQSSQIHGKMDSLMSIIFVGLAM